ncbi:MAG: hypothetical protein JOY90_30810 [Bradyrhizobium sp.]|uniref:hypothetical protein n=1 Tax=Bradyrhizobium sp. TaxID=376 RepID=UPI001D97C05A|nr:hypothetical protein [Bradyrhizobium sp.]MBV9564803.1 hypothetical protein [Bradyrhizobium sp.]
MRMSKDTRSSFVHFMQQGLVAAACLLAASLEATAQTGDTISLARLTGAWRVTAVDLQPGGEIQALTQNDPADMGAILDISTERLKWRPGKGSAFSDVCEGPFLEPDATLACAKGNFGYAGATLKIVGPRLRLEWYDNAILTLSKVPPPR